MIGAENAVDTCSITKGGAPRSYVTFHIPGGSCCSSKD